MDRQKHLDMLRSRNSNHGIRFDKSGHLQRDKRFKTFRWTCGMEKEELEHYRNVCTVCHENMVVPELGYDTCDECLNNER